ncbi:hypothetical protein BU16DRAFT_597986 [Lophium mytilinum]|uniref:Uncharacterized protein n=1 Tax=Lophium mytilinum TaxID=390894 RepID=A0A6A6Q9P2_9PEZI|nr:hypothetical protein BU16DRAFT_597986 [Lophium mytilinum]
MSRKSGACMDARGWQGPGRQSGGKLNTTLNITRFGQSQYRQASWPSPVDDGSIPPPQKTQDTPASGIPSRTTETTAATKRQRHDRRRIQSYVHSRPLYSYQQSPWLHHLRRHDAEPQQHQPTESPQSQHKPSEHNYGTQEEKRHPVLYSKTQSPSYRPHTSQH